MPEFPNTRIPLCSGSSWCVPLATVGCKKVLSRRRRLAPGSDSVMCVASSPLHVFHRVKTTTPLMKQHHMITQCSVLKQPFGFFVAGCRRNLSWRDWKWFFRGRIGCGLLAVGRDWTFRGGAGLRTVRRLWGRVDLSWQARMWVYHGWFGCGLFVARLQRGGRLGDLGTGISGTGEF